MRERYIPNNGRGNTHYEQGGNQHEEIDLSEEHSELKKERSQKRNRKDKDYQRKYEDDYDDDWN